MFNKTGRTTKREMVSPKGTNTRESGFEKEPVTKGKGVIQKRGKRSKKTNTRREKSGGEERLKKGGAKNTKK